MAESGRRERDLRYRYAMSLEEYHAMVAEQGSVCGICGSDDPLAPSWNIDHDNRCCPGGTKGCGECVRGLLCRRCNHLLGYAQDSPVILRSAINYLHAYRNAA